MKTRRYGTLVLLLAAISLSTVGPVEAAEPRSAFERLQALAGRWAGTAGNGQAAQATYQVMARGSAVVETLASEGDDRMITVYHMDGDDLRLTHYCGGQNQPRMKAISVSPDGRMVSFEFVDATNLASPNDGHMHALEITFIDNDQIEQKWTWVENGRQSHEVFRLSRVQ